MKFDEYSYTNRGGRSCNEDSVGSAHEVDSGLFVVADGLGGHEHGELASACVRDTLLEDFAPMKEGRADWLTERIAEANRRVLEKQAEMNSVLKSTVVTLAIDGECAVWANVGDSRLYYLHESAIYSYTEDHSVSYKKYKAGLITREEICTDEDQSRLLRSLGSEERNTPDVKICDVPLVPGDAFLLCSDGVWEYVRDEEIVIDLLKARNAREWAELLLLRLMNRISGENDNLTLLALMLK
jgi:serine/threonine protein phosphatase PrpC